MISRRAILVGAGAVAVAAAAPCAAAEPASKWPRQLTAVQTPSFKMRFVEVQEPLRCFLCEAEWDRFKLAGYSMRDCVKVEPVP